LNEDVLRIVVPWKSSRCRRNPHAKLRSSVSDAGPPLKCAQKRKDRKEIAYGAENGGVAVSYGWGPPRKANLR
jgi:hypothetical protein